MITHPTMQATAHDAATFRKAPRGRQREVSRDILRETVSHLPATFSWPVRLLLMFFAFAGSMVYALSHSGVTGTFDLMSVGWAVGIAAGTAWIGFGFILLTFAQMRPREFKNVTVLHWADACLITMTVGIFMKMIGIGANVALATFNDGVLDVSLVAPMQLSLLIAADIIMGLVFVRVAGRLRLSRGRAAMLWIVALNGILATVLTGLLMYGGFLP